MTVTKHAHARFKQRQKIKNRREMDRRFSLALARGTSIENEEVKRGTRHLLFGGFLYIVSRNEDVLITIIPAKKRSPSKRRHVIDEMRLRQCEADIRLIYMTNQ